MVERLRGHHVLSWSAVGVAAGALVVACFVPSLEIAIEAIIGAGNAQRGFRYERQLALAFDVGWPGPLAVVAGLALVIAYESPHGGPLLQPALDDLKAEARASPEARNPGWTLGGEHNFSSRGLTAWRVFLWATLALLWLTGYRLSRLALRPLASVSLVAAATAAIFAWLVLRSLTRLA